MDWGRLVGGLEWLFVALSAGVAVALHIRFVTEVGGLWRDETNSVNLATLPTFAEVWHFLDYDSFPVLYFAVLRAWTGIFGVGNDPALRSLGLLIGLGVLVALWTNARALGSRLPVLSLALVGLNPMIVRYGDSNRAYGLGILLILLTLWGFWRLVEQVPVRPSAWRIGVAAVLAVLSVQCLYYNSVLLLAIAAGAVAVAVRARAWRTVGIVLGLGALAAASLLPYAPIIIRMREWTFMVSYPADLAWLWKRSCEVTGSPDPLLIWVWVGMFLIGVLVVGSHAVLRFFGRTVEGGRRTILPGGVLFGGVALIVGVVAYAGFLRALQYCTQPWYYITLVAFCACTFDAVFGAWPAGERGAGIPILSSALRGGRLLLALLFLSLAALPAWKELRTRHTNVDLLAGQLASLTSKDDLVLVPRWECAIPLSRYYHGPARVISLPPIEDHRFHRYDLVLREMGAADPLRPVFTTMEGVLRSGHRVFVAGGFPGPRAGLPPPSIQPSGAWRDLSHGALWQYRVAYFLRDHAANFSQSTVPVPGGNPVQGFEHLGLGVFDGWK